MGAKRLALILITLGVGCGRPFDVKTAAGFTEQRERLEYEDYAAVPTYRAETRDHVFVWVHAYASHEQDLDVSTQRLIRHAHEGGYALRTSQAVRSKDGTPGRLLVFSGRDSMPAQGSDYRVTVYVAQGRAFVLESGGEHERFVTTLPTVERMERSLTVRCPSRFAPVLASRTCNRW